MSIAVRRAITVPAAGEFSYVGVAGRVVYVEESPDNTPEGVPTFHLTRGGSGVPLYSRSALAYLPAWPHFYVRGTAESAGATLYLLIYDDPCGEGVHGPGASFVPNPCSEAEEPEGLEFVDVANLAHHRTANPVNNMGSAERRAAVNGTDVYLVGGHWVPGLNIANKLVTQKYDTQTGTVTTLADLPAGAVSPAVGMIGGTIFVLGGRFISGGVSHRTTAIHAYDVATDSWNTLTATTPIEFNAAKAVVYDNKIYLVACGVGGDDDVGALCVYDPVSGTFTVLETLDVFEELGSGGVGEPVVFGGRIHFLRGRSSILYRYDPVSGVLDEISGVYQRGAENPTCGLIGGRYLIAAGGHLWDGSGPMGSDEVFDTVEVIDLLTLKSLGPILTMDSKGFSRTPAVVGDVMYMFGGQNSLNSPSTGDRIRAISDSGSPF